MTSPARRDPPHPHAAALAQYRRRASVYDAELAWFEPMRRAAIARLPLQRGDTVLDIGCGTGLSLPLLLQAVGPGAASSASSSVPRCWRGPASACGMRAGAT